MSNIRKVLVAGGGIGGLCTAVGLLRQGIEVDIVEIKTKNAPLGVGIIQPANALRALDDLGLMEECLAAGFQTDEWRYFDATGNHLHTFKSLRLAGHEIPAYNAVTRPGLSEILSRAATSLGARVTFDASVEDYSELEGGIEVTLSSGQKGLYDILVGAEGIRSRLRRKLFGMGHEPVFQGHSAWRVNTPRPPEQTFQSMFWGVGAKAGLVPLSQELMYLLLVTEEPGNPFYERGKLYEMLHSRLQQFGGLIGDIRDKMSSDDDIVYTPVEEVRMPSPWHKGRILLIGDAAHAGGPHISQGAAMAIEDAVVLSELAGSGLSVDDVFARFMARRFERCRFIQDTTKAIGELGRSTDRAACVTRNASFKNMRHDVPRPHEEVIAQRP